MVDCKCFMRVESSRTPQTSQSITKRNPRSGSGQRPHTKPTTSIAIEILTTFDLKMLNFQLPQVIISATHFSPRPRCGFPVPAVPVLTSETSASSPRLALAWKRSKVKRKRITRSPATKLDTKAVRNLEDAGCWRGIMMITITIYSLRWSWKN